MDIQSAWTNIVGVCENYKGLSMKDAQLLHESIQTVAYALFPPAPLDKKEGMETFNIG